MNLDEKFLATLRCPVTRQALRIAPPDVLARLDPPLDAGLIREDGRVVYPVRNGIPVLLADEAIMLPP
jgi:uncharacterized protein YbaR (Trm112 family)